MKKKASTKFKERGSRIGAAGGCAWRLLCRCRAAAGDRDNRLFDTHTVVVGDDGRSSVMIQSDAEIAIFQRTGLAGHGRLFQARQRVGRPAGLPNHELESAGLGVSGE